MRIVIERVLDGMDLNNYRIIDIPMLYYQRQKSRQKLTVNDLDIIITLERHHKLKPYSVIFVSEEDRIAYRIVPAEEEIIEVKVRDKSEALKVGHILGNMHMPVGFDYERESVILLYDESVENKLKEKGFEPIKKIGRFIEISEVEHHG